jgi:hypothetical protein
LSRWCVFTSRFDASPSFSLAVAAAARATIASARVSGGGVDLAREGNRSRVSLGRGFRARVATPSTPLDAARAATRRRAARRRRRGDAERAIRRRRRRARAVRDVPSARVF